ncbi:hypothetical protein N8251_00425 [Alphaproteobacteria bacterium]|nr:hypothetical protein [Alphaproteobacteria bacterium]
MYKIIILIIIFSQFLLGCSLKKDNQIVQQLNCPKHFIISEADSVIYKNNSILSILNNSQLNCYQTIDDQNKVHIDIINNYQLINIPDNELFEGQFNSLFFVTNRNETVKIHSSSKEILFNNKIKKNDNGDGPFLDNIKIQNSISVILNLSDYSKGLRIFLAIN